MSEAETILKYMLDDAGIEHQREYRFAAEHVGLGTGIRQRLKESDVVRFTFCVVL